ncbi:hypothetical protein UlMin_010138 [Ulmus minor]
MAQDKPKRVYQAWKGSNGIKISNLFCKSIILRLQFCICYAFVFAFYPSLFFSQKKLYDGRFIFGLDVASPFLSVLLIAGLAIAFCIRAYNEVKHMEEKYQNNWYPVLVLGSILSVLDLTFLFLTYCRGPRIVPRNTKPLELDKTYVCTPSMEWVNGQTPHLRLPRTKDILVNVHTIKVKYCDTSELSVLLLVHINVIVLCIYVFVSSLIHIVRNNEFFWKAIKGDISWIVGSLIVFHLYLIKLHIDEFYYFFYYNKIQFLHHIEFSDPGLSIGIVTAIAAPESFKVDFEGNGGHAGAVLMPNR